MSSAAFLLVIAHVATSGVAPQADEGTAAHLWQLLMVGQLPVIAFFAVRWAARTPRQGLVVLLAQLLFAIAAVAPVYLLRF
jgi:hypothetical protein